MTSSETISAARQTLDQLRGELLAARTGNGHWTGRLSSSALSTATAISALAVMQKSAGDDDAAGKATRLKLIDKGIASLSGSQNDDGGFGDTDRSCSNIATTYLVLAADSLSRQCGGATIGWAATSAAEDYVQRCDGIDGLKRRYGKDKTFVVPILTNLAIAGRVDWSVVASLPFELAAVPRQFYAAVRMPVVSYAVPALVAIGQVKHHHRPTRALPLRWLRNGLIGPTMSVLADMQPQSGGYLEATPLTSFVLMSLADSGRRDSGVAAKCERFLFDSVRDDGTWPIDTNLATWVTSLSIESLAADPADDQSWNTESLRRWHRSCQYDVVHPFTSSPPGGWGWTDLSGAVPDGDDTPAAVLATKIIGRQSVVNQIQAEAANFVAGDLTVDDRDVADSIAAGQIWLRKLQNRDGGLPTFCRGWGRLPFDRSSVDLTAHAIRSGGIDEHAAIRFLCKKQNRDGSWSPLWFGNQDRDDEDNPIYGTSRVLMAADRLPIKNVLAGVNFLIGAQNEDGGWGGGPSMAAIYGDVAAISSVEETALGLESLALTRRLVAFADGGAADAAELAIIRATRWLVRAVELRWHLRANPIGFYFAKLWYYEELYPLIFATRALGTVLQTSQSNSH